MLTNRSCGSASADHRPSPRSARGIALAEIVIALSLLAIVISSAVQLLAYTARATQLGRQRSSAAALAAQKLEQLASLAWTYDEAGAPLSDAFTDITSTPEGVGSGAGLAYAPAATLAANTSGYCDFADAQGRQLTGGPSPPPGTAFVRRWAIRPLPDDPVDTVLLAVRVLPVEDASGGAGASSGVTFTTMRTREMW